MALIKTSKLGLTYLGVGQTNQASSDPRSTLYFYAPESLPPLSKLQISTPINPFDISLLVARQRLSYTTILKELLEPYLAAAREHAHIFSAQHLLLLRGARTISAIKSEV